MPSEEIVTKPEEDASSSALHDNIKTKGQNSYYYAHKKRENVEIHEWDGNAEPRLLKTEQFDKEEKEIVDSITNYAWSDGKNKVSVYVNLENIGEHPEENIQLDWTATTFTLRIKKYEGKTRLLSINLNEEISDVQMKRKEHKLVISLQKTKEFSWHSLKKSS
jgi:calcyclin binding protein